MSQIVPIEPIPNQRFSINLDDDRYDIELRSSGNNVIATITRNEQLIISGVRCVGGTPIIPYEYLYSGHGNFIFDTPNNVIPYYTNFNESQYLVYITAAEVEASSA